MTRHKDADWNLPTGDLCYSGASLAVLMDLRDELKVLNRLLACPNFTGIPATLRAIQRNTAKPKKRARKVAS